MLIFHLRRYLYYKALNTFVVGFVGGSIFTIYATLSPSVFSLGGLILAIGLWSVATLYKRLMTIDRFYHISLGIEVLFFVMVLYFLVYPKNALTPLLIYGIYQVIFMFGSYLVRAESYLIGKIEAIKLIDRVKQQGYILGLISSYGFYELSRYLGITSAQQQVYDLHGILLFVQFFVMVSLYMSFVKQEPFV